MRIYGQKTHFVKLLYKWQINNLEELSMLIREIMSCLHIAPTILKGLVEPLVMRAHQNPLLSVKSIFAHKKRPWQIHWILRYIRIKHDMKGSRVKRRRKLKGYKGFVEDFQLSVEKAEKKRKKKKRNHQQADIYTHSEEKTKIKNYCMQNLSLSHHYFIDLIASLVFLMQFMEHFPPTKKY